MLLKFLIFNMKESILVAILNHDRRKKSVFNYGIILSIKLLGVLEGFVNWKQVSLFSIILLLALVASGIPFGYMIGSNESWQNELPSWYSYAQWLASFTVGFVVFITMAFKYPVKPYAHAFCISILVTVTSTVLELVIIQNIVPTVFIIETILLLLALVLGTYIGKCLTKKSVVTNT